jgi:uncharacterized membrane protein
MASTRFWKGFATGAAAGAAGAIGSMLAWKAIGRVRNGRVLRFEKSLQIGRPVSEVFRAWSTLEDLPRHVDFIESVAVSGRRSHWVMQPAGRKVEWEAEVTQLIPNEAIGWKSISGPKHTGRIDFSPIGGDTLIHVTMNYAPPLRPAHLFAPAATEIQHYIEQALRDFKAALEGKGQEGRRSFTDLRENRATGTYGSIAPPSNTAAAAPSGSIGPSSAAAGDLDRHTQTGRFGNPETTVDYTRPPEKKYP